MRYNRRLPTADYVTNDRWKHLVAEHLFNGSLALVLGAGASAGMGLPAWPELVRRCLDDAGIPYDPSDFTGSPSGERLGLYIDEVEEKFPPHEYHARVSKALYAGVTLGTEICQAPLLIALGALLMGSRRGSIRDVVTFNFDIVLEYYLKLHGYTIQTYDSIPQLRTAADVRIAHINGALSHPAYPLPTPKRLVFSARSMHERAGVPFEPWEELFRELLRSHLVLFIGLSGSDPLLFPLLTAVDTQIRAERPTGVWLFGKDIDSDPDSLYKTSNFISRNVIPVCEPSYDAIPNSLLEVCQIAARQF
jgi:SIR2-like domain